MIAWLTDAVAVLHGPWIEKGKMPGQNAIPATRASLVPQTASTTELEIPVWPALQPEKRWL